MNYLQASKVYHMQTTINGNPDDQSYSVFWLSLDHQFTKLHLFHRTKLTVVFYVIHHFIVTILLFTLSIESFYVLFCVKKL